MKPWITLALQKSMSVKKLFLNCNGSQIKQHFDTTYKNYRNILSTLMKRCKTIYYNHYFDFNWNNIKNNWKVINSILNIKPKPSDVFQKF